MAEEKKTPPPPPTIRAFIAGQSGAGKSTRAESMYLKKFPRRLLLDMTGEHDDRSDCVVYTVHDLAHALRNYSHRGKWTIGMSFGPDEVKSLVHYLCPVPDLRKSPIRMIGGAVLLVDEVDLIAPPRTSSEEIRTLYRRSRHIGLSVISTTQRPANVSREVTAQSQQMVALALSEPADREYMISAMRMTRTQVIQWESWTLRHPHGGMWRNLVSGEVLWLPDSGPPQIRGPGVEQISLADPAS